jgi:hypothetical protein
MLREADVIIDQLSPDQVGRAVLSDDGHLFRGTVDELASALASGALRFHEGAIRGALPQIVGP